MQSDLRLHLFGVQSSAAFSLCRGATLGARGDVVARPACLARRVVGEYCATASCRRLLRTRHQSD